MLPAENAGEAAPPGRRPRLLIAVAAALAVAAGAAVDVALLALRAEDRAHRAEDRAQIRAQALLGRSIAQSAAAQAGSPRLGALLALEAVARDSGPAEKGALIAALASAPSSQAVLRGSRLSLWGDGGPVAQVQFGAAHRLTALSADGSFRYWDADAKWETNETSGPGSETAFVSVPELSGALLGGSDGRVWFRLDSGQGLPRRGGHLRIVDAAVTPDHRVGATASLDGTITFWSLPELRPLGRPLVVPGSATSIAFDPTGRILYSVGELGLVRRWNVLTHAEIRPARRPQEIGRWQLFAIAVNPVTGGLAVGGRERRVYYLDARGRTLGEPAVTASNSSVDALAFSPDGRYLAVGENSGMVETWRGDAHVPVNAPFVGHDGDVVSLAFSSDSRLLASGGHDGTVRVWRVAMRGLPSVESRASATVGALALDRAGTKVAAGSWDGSIRLWSTTAGARVVTVREPDAEKSVTSVGLDDAGRRLVATVVEQISADHPKTFIEAWDVAGAPVMRWRRELDVDDFPAPSVVSPDGSTVAVVGFESEVDVLDARSGKRRHVLRSESEARELAFSADGSLLAVTSDEGPNRLWRVSDGSDLGELPSPDYVALGVAFSHSGRYLALTDDPDGASLLVKRGDSYVVRSRLEGAGDMEAVAFSPDDTMLAAVGADGNLVLWDVATGDLVARIPSGGHDGFAVAWQGRSLLTAHEQGLVASWDTAAIGSDLAHAAARLCPLARPALSRAEWLRFVPGEAYAPVCR